MPTPAQNIESSRRRSGLSLNHLAALAGLEPARLQALEAGHDEPTPSELDAVARVFGLPMREFLAGLGDETPLGQLFLRNQELLEAGAGDALLELCQYGAQQVLGEFVRCVHYLHRLIPSAASDVTTLFPGQPLDAAPPFGMDRFAAGVRRMLAIAPDAPIESMRGVMDRLGIEVFFVSEDVLSAPFDGASVASPRPAVLVNLVGGPSCWWRIRMTLAHELGHILLDHRSREHDVAIISPRPGERRSRWNFFDGHEAVERRANAFAAHFLAPAEAIMALVDAGDPTAEASVTAVCQQFQIGRTTAIYRLAHTFRLDVRTRTRMLARDPGEVHGPLHVDAVSISEIGLRAGRLREAVVGALLAGRVSRVEAREMLGLGLSDALPDDPRLSEADRRPLRDPVQRVLSAARAFLGDSPDTRDFEPVRARPAPGGWRVELVRYLDVNEVEPRPDVALRVTYDLSQVSWMNA